MITEGIICVYREQESSKNIELHIKPIANNEKAKYESTLFIGGKECINEEYNYSDSSKKYFKTRRKLWNHINEMISTAKKINKLPCSLY